MLDKIFSVGPVTLHSYGAMLVVALLVAMYIGRKRAKTYGLTSDHIYDAAFWAMIPGVLGARIVFIAQEWRHFSQHPNEIYSLQFSGLTSFGGVVFGLLGLWLWSKKARVPTLAVLDTLGAAFLVAHPIGRIGCLLNGCCYGRPCTDWYCVKVGPEFLGRFQPAQLYDGVFNLLGLLILLVIERRGILKLGQSFGLAIFFHGLARFIYEFWRAGTVEEVAKGIASSTLIPGWPITEAQVAALVLCAIGVAVFILNSRQKPVKEIST